MQIQAQPKSCYGTNANYDLYISQTGDELSIYLINLIDDSLYHMSTRSKTMPQSCLNIFDETQHLYEHLEKNLQSKQMIVINDIGGIKIYQILDHKGKKIKLECHLQTQKVEQMQLKNKMLMNLIKLMKVSKGKEAQKTKIKRIRLYADIKRNPFLSHFDYYDKGGWHLRLTEECKKWMKMRFDYVVPKIGKYYCSFLIEQSQQSHIEFGIMDKMEKISHNESPTSLSFYLNNGQLKDSNLKKEDPKTNWRTIKSLLKSKKRKETLLRMELDLDEQEIRYFCDGQEMGWSYITDYLMGSGFVVYVNFWNAGDCILLNHEQEKK